MSVIPSGNSTIKLQDVVDDAASLAELAPALATAGYSDQPALSIANDVITAMLAGGSKGQPFNWKWNRFNVTAFPTIGYQQDYFIPGLVQLGWLESCWASDINNVSIPKPKASEIEVHKDLDVTYWQTGVPVKISWMYNYLLQTGTWGESPLGPTANNSGGETNVTGTNPSGAQNPGPNVIYTNPVAGNNITPINAVTAIRANDSLWALTTYGTCGSVEPTWPDPADVVFPTYQDPTITATTVTDGTSEWTAINPNGQGMRLNPIPPQTGKVWLIQPVAQLRIPIFRNLTQTLDPVPDDYYSYFKQGFFTQCYRRSPDAKVRGKFAQEWQLWLDALDKAVRQGQREIDDFGFYPTQSIMGSGGQGLWLGPAWPYGYGGGGA